MSWSLRLSNGDFVPSRGSLSTARNSTKLVQDLKCFILQEIGSDGYHPEYGSKIDGGVDSGAPVPSLLGNPSAFAKGEIEAELKRIIGIYQRQQLIRARQDQATNGRITLDQGEVLVNLNGISFEQNGDRLRATISITTGDKSTFEIQVPVG
jgi:hypothetical protein